MTERISDEMTAYVAELAKLALTPEQSAQAGRDMGRMLAYIERLNELDTSGVEPLYLRAAAENVFREDEVTNGAPDGSILANAPRQSGAYFQVPRTVERTEDAKPEDTGSPKKAESRREAETGEKVQPGSEVSGEGGQQR